MSINNNIWGPPFWKTLHIICHHYPLQPNSIMKKKMYDFFHNLPVFLPDHDIGDKFSEILDKYPMKPYLDTRDSLCKWIHFIHNQINIRLNKPQLSAIGNSGDFRQRYEFVSHFEEMRKNPIII